MLNESLNAYEREINQCCSSVKLNKSTFFNIQVYTLINEYRYTKFLIFEQISNL